MPGATSCLEGRADAEDGRHLDTVTAQPGVGEAASGHTIVRPEATSCSGHSFVGGNGVAWSVRRAARSCPSVVFTW